MGRQRPHTGPEIRAKNRAALSTDKRFHLSVRHTWQIEGSVAKKTEKPSLGKQWGLRPSPIAP